MWSTISNGSYRLNPKCFSYYMSIDGNSNPHEMTMTIALCNSNIELADWLNSRYKLAFKPEHVGNALSSGNLDVAMYLINKSIDPPEHKFEAACRGGPHMIELLLKLGYKINNTDLDNLCEICIITNSMISKHSLSYLIRNYNCSEFAKRHLSIAILCDNLNSFLTLIGLGYIVDYDILSLILNNKRSRIYRWTMEYYNLHVQPSS